MNLHTFAIGRFNREADRTGIPHKRLVKLHLVQRSREGKRLAFA